MRIPTSILAGVSLVAMLGRPALAQGAGDFAAWFAMMSTPNAALPSAVTPGMLVPGSRPARSSFEVRYGRFAFDRSEAVNTVGIGARTGAFGLITGYQSCNGCDGNLQLGVDFEGRIATRMLGSAGSSQILVVGVRPALGYGLGLGDGAGDAMSATVDVPLSIATLVGSGRQVVVYAAPGFGFGRLSNNNDSASGTRGSIAAGIGLMDLAGGVGLGAGWRKVLLEDAPSTWGLSVSFTR